MARIRPDLLWKGIIESLAEDFLRLFFPIWSKSIDFQRGFEFLDNELAQLSPESAAQRRVTDKLIKVFFKDGSEKWVLIHVEVQGYRDKDFARRLFIYYYRLYDRYALPITTLAIFIDPHPDYHPQIYETELAGTSLSFRFNTFKLLDYPLEQLRNMNNPFARVLETASLFLSPRRISDSNLLQKMIDMVRRMKSDGYELQKIRYLMDFIRMSIEFKNKRIIRKFESEIYKIFDKSRAMGIEEIILEETKKQGVQEGLEQGLEQGLQEAKIQFVRNCWKEGLTVELTATIAELTPERVTELFDQFTAEAEE